jgi:hypothetical protein
MSMPTAIAGTTAPRRSPGALSAACGSRLPVPPSITFLNHALSRSPLPPPFLSLSRRKGHRSPPPSISSVCKLFTLVPLAKGFPSLRQRHLAAPITCDCFPSTESIGAPPSPLFLVWAAATHMSSSFFRSARPSPTLYHLSTSSDNIKPPPAVVGDSPPTEHRLPHRLSGPPSSPRLSEPPSQRSCLTRPPFFPHSFHVGTVAPRPSGPRQAPRHAR